MANISTMGRTTYTLTAADILAGFASVPVLWDSPFNDTNYAITWSVQDLGFPAPSLNYGVGDFHYKAAGGFTAVVAILAAIPLVQAQEDLIASTTATNIISLVAPALGTSLYQVTLYYGPSRTSAADAGDTWTPTITWTDPSSNVLTASGTSPTITLGPAAGGNTGSYGVNYMQSYNIPFFVKGGTTISVTGTYGGGTFPVNVSARIVQMPNNAVLPVPGDIIEIEAMASHR